MLLLQKLYFEVPFEEHEKWNNQRRKLLRKKVDKSFVGVEPENKKKEP
jgi:hypothetical protein